VSWIETRNGQKRCSESITADKAPPFLLIRYNNQPDRILHKDSRINKLVADIMVALNLTKHLHTILTSILLVEPSAP
jgi:hypothetical protein